MKRIEGDAHYLTKQAYCHCNVKWSHKHQEKNMNLDKENIDDVYSNEHFDIDNLNRLKKMLGNQIEMRFQIEKRKTFLKRWNICVIKNKSIKKII